MSQMPQLDNLDLDSTTKQNLELWLSPHTDTETKRAVQELIQYRPQEIVDAFYTTLSFGTGGLRGIMGVGSNRMNRYTVGAATQGLANYLNSIAQKGKTPSVFINYDSRLNSRLFAEEAARVFAANGVHVYIFKDIRPVALVSFACRYKKCDAAIMITASHNPPEYNGYKVYWNDGAQILPPHDQNIIKEVNKINDLSLIKSTLLTNPLIEWVGDEVDAAYLETIGKLQLYPQENKEHGKELKIVYTSLHGTGIKIIPRALAEWGFETVHPVEKQCIPDGTFPTVVSPNPEEPEALKMGTDVLLETGSDLLLATDPDADRVGVVVLHKGATIPLTGNQIACICLEHICQALTNQKRLPAKPAVIKTIVTTELFAAIANAYHITCFDVLTGFKYIAEKIHQWEQNPKSYQFIFGGEESYGYLLGTHARDKDAVVSCTLIAETALHVKLQNKTLVDMLNDIYKKYGIWREKLISVNFEESKAGKEQMKKTMQSLRESPLKTLLGTTITAIDDYLSQTTTIIESGKSKQILLPKSNVLTYHFADGTQIVIRPSGTEPKIKLYCSTHAQKFYSLEEGIEHCDVLADEYLRTFKIMCEK